MSSGKEKEQNKSSKDDLGLRSRDVIKLMKALEGVELTFDNLYYYEHTGLIVPSVRAAQGRGVPKLYSIEDFIVLRWLVALQKKGIPVQRFREVIQFLKKQMPEVLKKPENWILITDGESIQFFDRVSDRALDVLEDTGQYLFVFPIGKVAEESEEAVREFNKG